MSKVIVSATILGNEIIGTLLREINNWGFNNNVDPTHIWGEISASKDFPTIQEVVKKHFGEEIKLV